MTNGMIGLLFASMVVLAVVPGPGIYVVISRTLTYGFKAGLITTIGIILGDFVFIVLVYFGFSSLTEEWSTMLNLIILLGGAYLIYLSVVLFFAAFNESADNQKMIPQVELLPLQSKISLIHLLSGLFVTLSNPKAILFYASFLPVFLDSSVLDLADLITILFIAALAVGSVMIMYVYLTNRARRYVVTGKTNQLIHLLSALLMAFAGFVVLIRYL